jgi:ferredoxin
MRIAIDTSKCQAHQRCTVVAPAVFGLKADDAPVLKAAKSCPYRAITVTDEASNEQLWPRIVK